MISAARHGSLVTGPGRAGRSANCCSAVIAHSFVFRNIKCSLRRGWGKARGTSTKPRCFVYFYRKLPPYSDRKLFLRQLRILPPFLTDTFMGPLHWLRLARIFCCSRMYLRLIFFRRKFASITLGGRSLFYLIDRPRFRPRPILLVHFTATVAVPVYRWLRLVE